MDQQLEERLSAIEKTVKENNRILTKMRRVQRNANAARLFYWLFLVGMGLVALYFIKPYISMVGDLYKGGEGSDTSNLNSLLEQYQALQE